MPEMLVSRGVALRSTSNINACLQGGGPKINKQRGATENLPHTALSSQTRSLRQCPIQSPREPGSNQTHSTPPRCPNSSHTEPRNSSAACGTINNLSDNLHPCSVAPRRATTHPLYRPPSVAESRPPDTPRSPHGQWTTCWPGESQLLSCTSHPQTGILFHRIPPLQIFPSTRRPLMDDPNHSLPPARLR